VLPALGFSISEICLHAALEVSISTRFIRKNFGPQTRKKSKTMSRPLTPLPAVSHLGEQLQAEPLKEPILLLQDLLNPSQQMPWEMLEILGQMN